MAFFRSIWDELRAAFRTGNMVTKLVLVNFVVWVSLSLVYLLLWVTMGWMGNFNLWFFNNIVSHLCMQAVPFKLLTHPWTLFTSIFLHQDFWHVITNIIWLYLFGTVVGDLIGDRRVLPIYLMGGLVGNLLFMLSANIFSGVVGLYALGASGAVMAFAGTALMLAPDYRVALLLLGEVKLKYIVLVMVLLDLLGISYTNNTGGHVAHLGGFFFGILFVYRLRDGHDLLRPMHYIIDRIVLFFKQEKMPRQTPRRKPTLQKVYQQPDGRSRNVREVVPGDPSVFQEKLDAILDKIKAEGYDSLNQEEKEFLFQASKKK